MLALGETTDVGMEQDGKSNNYALTVMNDQINK